MGGAARGGGTEWVPLFLKSLVLVALLSPPLFSMRYLSEPSTAYAFVFVLDLLLLLSTSWSFVAGDAVFKTTLVPFVALGLALAAHHWELVDRTVFVYIVGVLGVVVSLGATFIANLMGKARSKRAGYVLNIVALASPLLASAAGALLDRRVVYQAGVMLSLTCSGVNLLFNKGGRGKTR